jgi:Uma2 family endonuclease
MSVATVTLPLDLTIEAFLDWCPEDGQRWQLVDGEPVAMAPAGIPHGVLQARLARLLGNHLETVRPGCSVATAPGIVPSARASRNFRVPDLGVTCAPIAANDVRLPDPVLLVEILSRSNARDTRANVWAYTTIPSVQEILVLHAERRRAELLRRGEDGNWPAEPILVEDGVLRLESLGFEATIEEIYRTTGIG